MRYLRSSIAFLVFPISPLVLPTSGVSREARIDRVAAYEASGVFRWTRALSDGDFLVLAPLQGGGMQALDSGGQALWRAPAEAISSNWLVALELLGDTVVVFDPLTETETRFSRRGEALSKRWIPYGTTYRSGRDGSVFFTANERTPEMIGFGVHELSASGQINSFGYEGEPIIASKTSPWDHEWKLIPGGSGPALWTHYRDRFLVEEWRDGGRTGRRLESDPGWLAREESYSHEHIPQPFLHSGFIEGDHLWLVGHALEEDWREVTGDPWDGSLPTLDQERRMYDSVVELWSLDEAKRVWQLRVDEFFYGFASPGVLFSLQERPDGGTALVVWQVARSSSEIGGLR